VSRASVAGKRRAEKPTRRARLAEPARRAAAPRREPAAAPPAEASLAEEATLVLPMTRDDAPAGGASLPATTYQAYRVGGVRAASGPSRPGARRSASRAPILPGVPSAPVLLGIAALAVSAGGAVTATGSLSEDAFPRFSQASALSGASDISRVTPLDRAVTSRDSRRDALADASARKLRDRVEEQSKQRSTALLKLTRQEQAYAKQLRLNRWVIPLSGYRITARYGDSSGLWSRYHTGLDFAAPSGTTISAIAGGVVTFTGYDGAYGNKTVVTLEDGTEIWYCHQTSYTVAVGQEVRAGETIGYVGSTGNVTGPHLHLEVRPGGGDPVDPYAALVVNGVTP